MDDHIEHTINIISVIVPYTANLRSVSKDLIWQGISTGIHAEIREIS